MKKDVIRRIKVGLVASVVLSSHSYAADLSRILATGSAPICGLERWELWENWEQIRGDFVKCPQEVPNSECDDKAIAAKLEKPVPQPVFLTCEHILVPSPPFLPVGMPVTLQAPFNEDEILIGQVIGRAFRYTEFNLPNPMFHSESPYLSNDCIQLLEGYQKNYLQVEKGFGVLDGDHIFGEKMKSCQKDFYIKLVKNYPKDPSVIQFDRLTKYLHSIDLSEFEQRRRLWEYVHYMDNLVEKVPLEQALDKLIRY